MIELRGVSAGYGDTVVIEDIDLTLEHPFFAVVIGPNGAGKTTLLKVILGLVRRRKGSVSVFGIDPEIDRKGLGKIVSYMPQSAVVNQEIPFRVFDVVSAPLELGGSRDPEAVRRALSLVGLEGFEKKLFSSLSGGQRARALIARALVKRSKLVLLDEPFSHVDPEGRSEIFSLLHRIHVEEGVSFLIVGHDLSVCSLYDPKVLVLNRRVIAFGRFSEVVKPAILAKAYGSVLAGRDFVFMGEEHG